MRVVYEVRNRYEVQYRDDDQGWLTDTRYDFAPRAFAQARNLAGIHKEARVIDYEEPEED